MYHVILKGTLFNTKISYFEWLDRVEETYIQLWVPYTSLSI